MTTAYPLSAVRTLALHAQGLTVANGAEPKPSLNQIYKTVEQLRYVQIDTLNLIRRSHYITLWSRLGNYAPGDFDRLIYDPEQRKLFEGLVGVAAIIPLKDFRYQLPQTDHRRELLIRWYTSLMKGNLEQLPMVLERVRQEGALRAADFEYKGPKRGSWWDWKPAKSALE